MSKAYSFLKIIFKILVGLICLTRPASAFHLGIIGGAVEEGDDRLRPIVGADLGVWDEFVNARLIMYGTKFSVVSQQTAIAALSLRPRIPVASSKRFFANIGMWGLQEKTTIGETQNYYKKEETLTAYGLVLGIRFKFVDAKYFYMSADWDGYLYFPGTASIYFATGRRQTLCLSSGILL